MIFFSFFCDDPFVMSFGALDGILLLFDLFAFLANTSIRVLPSNFVKWIMHVYMYCFIALVSHGS